MSSLRAITVSNGDCYLTQWLCPRAPGASGAYLVDFDSVSANYAAYDLVYMLATFWTWAQRRDQGHELDALGIYHRALVDDTKPFWICRIVRKDLSAVRS